MRPEDIDKIFRERLGGASPTPPADLWNRLQDRMQAESPHKIKQKEEKRSFMWIYSSVAATLSLLLTVGVVFYNIKSTPEVSDSLVKQDKTMLRETPVYFTPKAETIVQTETTAEENENNFEPQATGSVIPASSNTEKDNNPAIVAKADLKAVQQNKTTRAAIAERPKANVQQAIAGNNQTMESPTEAATVAPTTKAVVPSAVASDANFNARPVEIIIKRSASSTEATALIEPEEPSSFEKKAKLAKSIFKQARNLANGEQVELADLGIRADRVALETQIGKQKFSKVINL